MQSLAVKYRPKAFSDVCGQESTVKILSRQIDTHTFANAYLFCGASGCGKTTSARIMASLINKGVGTPIEIDAASYSGVDNVREIIKQARERSLDSEYKVYIVDETHALSSQAWQAFLKCIEEPPEYTIFIFCTTEPNKIPKTILNRVQRFDFHKIPEEFILNRLKYISSMESMTADDDALRYIAKLSGGGMRDAITLLDTCVSYNKSITIANVQEALGMYSYDTMYTVVNSMIDRDEKTLLTTVHEVFNSGKSAKLFVEQLLKFVLDVQKYFIFGDLSVTSIPAIYENDTRKMSVQNAIPYFGYVTKNMLQLKNSIKNEPDMEPLIEIMLLKITRCEP